MTQLPGVIVKDGWDVTSPEVHQKIVEFLNGRKANVIMRCVWYSAMAPVCFSIGWNLFLCYFLVTWLQMQQECTKWTTRESWSAYIYYELFVFWLDPGTESLIKYCGISFPRVSVSLPTH